jgi:hypothetical protein
VLALDALDVSCETLEGPQEVAPIVVIADRQVDRPAPSDGRE